MARHALHPGRAYSVLKIACLGRRPLVIALTGYLRGYLLIPGAHPGAQGLELALLPTAGQVLLYIPGSLVRPLDLLGRGGEDVHPHRLAVTGAGNVAEGDVAVDGAFVDLGRERGGRHQQGEADDQGA
ncbi:hypothetical protein D3C76_1300890 [compost metagenome]